MTEQTTSIDTPPGGIMTDEVGAVTGRVSVVTTPGQDGGLVVAVTVSYEGASERYTVTGSPVVTATHEQVLERLRTDPGTTSSGNPATVDLVA